ncbi:MBL fold metallo-hydrolase [Desulfonema magnum]|uniref:Beta-lactamase domain-containing protein n=1 Tax=Desulfonema magnum TaxID=45655 RepID=A0A975BH65_9BACT|nr:MBL fold metallo-hydrolase [Desulfonema magnum]QTA85134.1 Beta-lactamase domain-containing protein [Desulfonema magnum]
MKETDRRHFVRTMVAGDAVPSGGGSVVHKASETLAESKYDIGQCKSVKIKCISEVGWFDEEKLVGQMNAAGGLETNQWIIPWDPENAAGSSTLIDMESLDGTHHKFLLDTGWNTAYMDNCFKREGIDKMLKNGEIEFLMISHEHLDHFWGLESVLKYNPEIKILIPDTFYPEGMQFLKGAEFITAGTRNGIPHQGELVRFEPGKVNKLYDGCAAVAFDLPILIRVRGEASLYFNVKDKGIVCVTGCCHQTILTFADFARENIVGGENLYGVYGGLHIAPFGPMNPEREHLVKGMGKYGFKKIACNHCTGLAAVQRMIELGYPVVRGTGRNGSASDLYVGNGDEVSFG